MDSAESFCASVGSHHVSEKCAEYPKGRCEVFFNPLMAPHWDCSGNAPERIFCVDRLFGFSREQV